MIENCEIIIRPDQSVSFNSSSDFTPIRHPRRQLTEEFPRTNNYYSRIFANLAPRVTRQLEIEVDRESDGRWIAEVPDIPGAMVYGNSREDAIEKVVQLAFRALADDVDDKSDSVAVHLTLLVPHEPVGIR